MAGACHQALVEGPGQRSAVLVQLVPLQDAPRPPWLSHPRANAILCAGGGHRVVPPARQEELTGALAALDRPIPVAARTLRLE